MGLADGKQLIKIIFDIKIKIGIFEISNVPNFNKLGAFLILGTNLGLIGAKYFRKILFDIKIENSTLEYSMCQISINSEHV